MAQLPNCIVRILHIIKQVTNGGASMGLLNMCSEKHNNVRHTIGSLLKPQDSDITPFAELGLTVLIGTDAILAAIEHHDIIQLEWWNNPYINNFIVNTQLPACRILLHARGHFDAPLMNPSLALLSHVDECTVTTPGAAKNAVFEKNRIKAALDYPRCVYSAATKKTRPARCKNTSENIVFGYLGTVEPIKLHSQALQIAANVIKQNDNINFKFAGEGVLDEYREQARQLGIDQHVEFLGFQQQPDDFLNQLDVFFYPLNKFTYATSEKALQEAMLAALPCIVFPYGGVKDLVDKISAKIVNTIPEAVEACLDLASSEKTRQSYGVNAFNTMSAFPYRNNWRQEIVAVWHKMMKKPRRHRAVLKIPRDQLCGKCTDQSSSHLLCTDAQDLADLQRVSHFVEQDYVNWLST